MKLCQLYFSYGTNLYDPYQQREAWCIFMKFAFTKAGNFLALIVSHPECSEWWVLQNGSNFWVCDEFLCDHSNKTSLAALKEGKICFSALFKMKLGKFATILGVMGQIKVDDFSEVSSPLSESCKPEPCTLTTLAARKTAFSCKKTQKRT